MPTYFPFSHVTGNNNTRINRTINRHHYSAPWTVTTPQVKLQPVVVATKPLTEIYY